MTIQGQIQRVEAPASIQCLPGCFRLQPCEGTQGFEKETQGSTALFLIVLIVIAVTQFPSINTQSGLDDCPVAFSLSHSLLEDPNAGAGMAVAGLQMRRGTRYPADWILKALSGF